MEGFVHNPPAAMLTNVIHGFGLLPSMCSGLATIGQAAAEAQEHCGPKQWARLRHRSDAERISAIFNEVLQECNLSKRGYQWKVSSNSAPARSVGSRTIDLGELVHDLLADEKQRQLSARFIIKHELGHLYHNNSGQLPVLMSLMTGLSYGAQQGIAYALSSSLPLFAIGTALAVCAQFKLFRAAEQAYVSWKEKQADDFAIRHTINPDELDAIAKKFEQEFNKIVATVPVRYYGQPILKLVSLQEMYDQRADKSQSVRDWVIANRDDPLIGSGNSSLRPCPYDRAIALRNAAAALRKHD